MTRKNRVSNSVILFFCLLILQSCYTEEVFDRNGDFRIKTKLFVYPKYESITNDGKLIKGFYLNAISDTFSSRCFSSNDIIELNKKLKNLQLIRGFFVIRRQISLSNDNCSGLFYLYLNKISKNNFFMIPILKTEKSILINSTYIEGNLCNRDSSSVLSDLKVLEKEEKNDSIYKQIARFYKFGVILNKNLILR